MLSRPINRRGHLRRRLALELACWSAAAALFLFLYIRTQGASISVIVPHAIVVLALWLGSVGVRLLLWRIRPGTATSTRISALVAVLPLTALTMWYAVVLIGLSSWGRIPTWALVWTYVRQAPELLLTLGFPTWLPLSAGVCLFPCAAWLVWRAPRLDWCELAVKQMTGAGSIVVALACLCVTASQGMRLASVTDFHPEEPVGASFFPARLRSMQSHDASATPGLDAAEQKASTAYQTAEAIRGRNVVLIIGDALRADHMGVHGYDRPTTPRLAASFEEHESYVFGNAKAICAESLCGLLGIASSRPLQAMPTHPITLHEVLRRHGYRVRLALGGDHTNFYGLREAYGPVDSYFDGTEQTALYVNDDTAVLHHIQSLPQSTDQPEFIQLHLMSTHGLGAKLDALAFFKPATNYYRWPSKGGRVAAGSEDARRAVNHYDNGVRQFDMFVSQILDELQVKGYLKDALVVITGDHGEMLGETGVFGHQHSVDESVLTVPLVVQRRGYSGPEFGSWGLVSQIDIAPTILSELGIEPPSTWRGVALQNRPSPRYVRFRQGNQSGVYFRSEEALFKYSIDATSGRISISEVSNDPLASRNLASRVRQGTRMRLMKASVLGDP